MRTGTPAPSRPAGGRTCTQRSGTSLTPACVSRASLAPRAGTPSRPGGRTITLAGAGKDAAPAIVSYTVQKGETIWDVAIQHGVSMRTIKDMNKLAGTDPVLVEGQQLLVPASGITAVAPVDDATSAAALGSTPARGLWVGSEHVRLASVGEAKELYLRQCDRGNSQNTLLVLYAPWCPHCRDMEDELERLAEGLSHVSAVRVVAVNCDAAEGRMFAREVLGVAYYPSIISFPEHSRTFFKYKGRQRDAESLLRFLNMTCCAREDQMWSLRPLGAKHSHQATIVAAGGKWFNQYLPVGTSPGAMAAAVGSMVLVAAAAAGLVAERRRRAAAAAASGDGATVDADVVAELDSSLGRMAALMLRAMGTRMALLLGLTGPPLPPAADAGEVVAASSAAVLSAPASAAPVAAAATAGPESASAPAGDRRPAAAAAARQIGSTGSNGVHVQPSGTASPADGSAAAASLLQPPSSNIPDSGRGRSSVVTPTVMGAAATAASPDPVLGPMSRGLTAEERMRLTRLTDDELIALVNSDPDLDKVLSRLLGDK
ncbi:hypothetical protein VOLCADRAFT_88507 [Volvox carteri f. nagariensis]|uniref:Thioredoxin domain-containing protein n=1 Tax=Volvox carteri f. nagariensis TaxID=3068 RepID=D8TP70_VOLCA|nr:uncharacterized protein VOLCADRAFT_88507 [Volvox carteri f. nagariensis]EFJ50569.1 hypothetical protein VOLCADRAFT_88507 [Volvox carteri f. nagariensis]|eukprot:XP_002948162.1 hypothetical protein VOLCADRAFT_88507 [Volvox carteri f. nagariensis]